MTFSEAQLLGTNCFEFFHMKLKTDEAYYKMVNDSKTGRVIFVESSYLFEGKTIFHILKKWNTGCTLTYKTEIIVWICGEGCSSFWTNTSIVLPESRQIQGVP